MWNEVQEGLTSGEEEVERGSEGSDIDSTQIGCSVEYGPPVANQRLLGKKDVSCLILPWYLRCYVPELERRYHSRSLPQRGGRLDVESRVFLAVI
eukprot:347016-Chlamydomonas_euryale.AAC.10